MTTVTFTGPQVDEGGGDDGRAMTPPDRIGWLPLIRRSSRLLKPRNQGGSRPATRGNVPPPVLRAGELVPGTPYRVVRPIGRGGMGEVVEVEHRSVGVRGALKVLHPSHVGRADLAERMRQEAHILSVVDHPAVVKVLDFGEIGDGRPYLLMELLDGHDLQEDVARFGPMAVARALALTAEALDGLAAVHAAGIVHRDVKLENLFLCADGTVKVIDFGVAKAFWAQGSPTMPGASPGTPRTMSPEQCALQAVDLRADLYAMGLLLYELCAGRGPFDEVRDEPHALRFAHCIRRPPSPAEVGAQPIPPAVEAAILRALSKSPSQRYQSAKEMAAALRRLASLPPRNLATQTTVPAVLERPRESGPTSPHRRAKEGVTRHPVVWLATMVSMLLLAFFVLGLVIGRTLR